MKRYNMRDVTPYMTVHPDGEWIRYEDHVEAMKRIAGTLPAADPIYDRYNFIMENGLPEYVPLGFYYQTDTGLYRGEFRTMEAAIDAAMSDSKTGI